jgi:hypothetical protein
MTNAGRLDFDQDFARLGLVQVDIHDNKRLACGNGNGGTRKHWSNPPDLNFRKGATARIKLQLWNRQFTGLEPSGLHCHRRMPR